jgi:hypothetical protein
MAALAGALTAADADTSSGHTSSKRKKARSREFIGLEIANRKSKIVN